MCSIGALRAHEPDGIHALFFHQYWDKTKHMLINLVNDFFSHNFPFCVFNHTNIAPIPKVDNPETVAQSLETHHKDY